MTPFNRRFRSRGAALLLACILPLTGKAQDVEPAGTLVLSALIERALQTNPELAASVLEARAMEHVGPQASSLSDPVIGITIPPNPIHTARGAQRSQWRLEQAFPFPGKRRLRGEIADLEAGIAREGSRTLAHNLILQVRIAFARLYAVQERMNVLAEFREEVQQFEEAAAAQYEVGRGPQQAVLRAQLEKNALAKREIDLRVEWQEMARELARITNDVEILSEEWTLDRPISLESAATDASEEVAMQQRPEVSALRTAATRADRRLSLARKENLPDFSVMLTYTDIVKRTPPATPDGMDAFAIGAGIRVPLWRGRIKNERQQREIERRQVNAELEAIELDIATRLAELRRRIALDQQTITLLADGLIPEAEITRDATLAAYQTGRAAFIDLLDAERMLFDLRLDKIEARMRLHETVANLHRVLGTPSEALNLNTDSHD